jgi:hypothetical protein
MNQNERSLEDSMDYESCEELEFVDANQLNEGEEIISSEDISHNSSILERFQKDMTFLNES